MSTNHLSQTDIALLGPFAAREDATLTRHISLEPKTWWEWHCPSCQGTFEQMGTCPQCRTRLRHTQVSLPFIWIG